MDSRFRWRLGHWTRRALEPVVVRVLTPQRLKSMASLPSLPAPFRARYAAVKGAWAPFEAPVPEALRSTPGIVRHSELEQSAFVEAPLHSFHHHYGRSVVWSLGKLWPSVVPVGPRLMRAIAHVQATHGASRAAMASAPAAPPSPEGVTAFVRDSAAALGLSAVGMCEYDEKYTFTDVVGAPVGGNVIVCVLEQNWKSTQLLPSTRGERTALSTNAELMELVTILAGELTAAGHPAQAHTTEGFSVVHHYAVAAGLGQLGFNGQLLTPQAGSRCRLALITTDAPLVLDQPRDYGIPKLCESCRICVRRCPSGAIPARRAESRGVEKNKLNLARCFPLVAQANGCSVCMKVCPVQRFGLGPVLAEFDRSGQILGKDTDELEGYRWPLDGRHYGPGQRPHLDAEFFDVPGFGSLAADGQHAVVDNPLM
jgi:epoxyqueuosine reductase